MTLANFQISGRTPYFNDELKTMVSGFQMKSAASLISLVEILSGPGALPFFSCLMLHICFIDRYKHHFVLLSIDMFERIIIKPGL